MNTIESTNLQERASIPRGWETAPLLELGDLIRGVTYKKQNASTEPFTDSIPILRANNIQHGNLVQGEIVHIPKNLVSEIQVITKGDILIATSSGSISVVGKAARAQNGMNAAFGAFCGLIRPRPETSSRYLGYYFGSQDYRQKASAMARGVNINNLKKSHFESLSVNLPPLNEQRRIADKLDTTLAAVEACKQKLNNAAETIQRFRQSVLAAAVSGELTREWREERGIKGEWEEITVKEAGKIQLGRQRSPKYHSGQTMRPYLRVQNVFEDRIDLEDVMVMDFPGKDLEKYKLHYGDILLNEGQSPQYLGRPAMYRGELDEACFTNTLIRFQANIQIVNPDFALLVFRHNMHSGRYISEGKITTNIAHLSLGRFGETEFPLPSLDEQEQISNTAADLFAQADSIGEAITSGLRAIERLSSSILAKAFRGELVPQDPNDEPASVLLERIKAQREAEAAAKKTAKRGRKKKADTAQLVIPEGIAENHLAKVLEECGALSERALLAASELEPAVFRLQLSKELKADGLKQVDIDGEAAYADAAWEE